MQNADCRMQITEVIIMLTNIEFNRKRYKRKIGKTFRLAKVQKSRMKNFVTF